MLIWRNVKFLVKSWFVNPAPSSNVAQHDGSRGEKTRTCSWEIDFLLGVRLESSGLHFHSINWTSANSGRALFMDFRDKGMRSVRKTGRDVCTSANIREKDKAAGRRRSSRSILIKLYLLSGTTVQTDHSRRCIRSNRCLLKKLTFYTAFWIFDSF